MVPLRVGQSVTYVDASGASNAATVVEPYQNAALINVTATGVNLTAPRLRFEDGQPPPYVTDADPVGGVVTEATFEAGVAEE